MITGTSHFESVQSAERYYAEYGYSDVKKAVAQKLADGEIHIGPPQLKEGEELRLNREEGRYFIIAGEA